MLAVTQRRSCRVWLLWSLLTGWCLTRSASAGEVAENRPYQMTEAYMDPGQDSVCQTQHSTMSIERVERNLSGYLYSHHPYGGPYWPNNKNCFLSLRAPRHYRIELRILEFSVDGDSGNNCAGDSLYIFDHETAVPDEVRVLEPGTVKHRFCGHIRNSTPPIRSARNVLTVWWHTEAKVKELDDRRGPMGFRLMWTVFRDVEVLKSDDKCDTREFLCAGSHTCIPVQLACDKVAHCSDASDLEPRRRRQAGCPDSDDDVRSLLGTMSVAAVAGICIGAVLGCVLFWVTIFVCCCDSCQKDRRRQPVPTYAA